MARSGDPCVAWPYAAFLHDRLRSLECHGELWQEDDLHRWCRDDQTGQWALHDQHPGASRHNGVHFFDIWTSKSGPNMWGLWGVFNIWLRNVLRASSRHNGVRIFWTYQLPKVVRGWGALYILTSKCASRHNGMQFFISHLASWLRTRRFSEPTFRPSGATNHWNTWKNTVFRGFPTLSRTRISFLLRLSLFWSSFFFSSLLWLFPSLLFICPYCQKFDF